MQGMDPHLAPPPPYSVTDRANSTAGAARSPILTPTTSCVDDAPVTAWPFPPTSSSFDEPFSTPCYTPVGSVNQNQVQSDTDHDHVSSSAAAYFESRPARRRSTHALEMVQISVTAQTDPRAVKYPQELVGKDINEQDWATFVNYLLPNHVSKVNNEIADRKVKAGMIDEPMRRLALGKESRSMADLREADAPLDPLRQPLPSTDSSRMLEATLSEWNEGFFVPRGIQMAICNADTEVAVGEEAARAPGSWIPWEHEMNPGGLRSNSPSTLKGFFSSFVQAGPQGFKMGPIVADNDGFRIGKNGLRADNNGFRLGNMLVADSNGFRLGGSRGFNADGTGLSLGGKTWARRGSHHAERDGERHAHRGRGRSHSDGQCRRRHNAAPSGSDDSSLSSSGSSESDVSVGSIPDYEDLMDCQLPVIKQSLMEWLDHSDQPITRDTVSEMRQSIQVATANDSRQESQDLSDMRREVKDLTKLFREAKRAQRKQRKDARKERRLVHRANRRERRLLRKEERTARREDGSNKRECRRCDLKGKARTSPPSMAHQVHGAAASSTSQHAGMKSPASPQNLLFGRSASFPFVKGLPFGKGTQMPLMSPGVAAVHRGWPYNHSSSSPGNLRPTTVNSEKLHDQALQFKMSADLKEARAIDLRTAATGQDVSEEDKSKMGDEATKLEEEAEKYRREADRLRAEASHLDEEMARELQEDRGNHGVDVEQESGIVPGPCVL